MTSNFICSWCALDGFISYEDYREHENTHFNIDFMNGVQREYVCSFCPWGHFMDYDEYCHHERSHEDIRALSCIEQPPPRRRGFFMEHAVNQSSVPTPSQSPMPGPSHVQSPQRRGSQLQTGGGSEGDTTFSYDMVKIKERTFKNSAKDTHYEVTFDGKNNGTKLSELYKQLENMFDDVIARSAEGIDGSDLGRVLIHHNGLNNPIVVPLQPINRLSGHSVMEHVEKVLNSNEELSVNDSIRIDVGTIQIPTGGRGKKIISIKNAVKNKRSIIEIRNNDNTCLSRAIVMAFLSANQVTTKVWNEMIQNENDPTISLEELIWKYKVCPVWYFKKLRNPKECGNRLDTLNFLVLSSVRLVGVDRKFTLNDISTFEEYLDVDVLVVCASMGNNFYRVPSEDSSRQRIFIYFVNDSHFHPISNIQGFFGASKFCERCLKAYQNKHQCSVSCFVCTSKKCHDDDADKQGFVSCRHCHMTCKSLACLNRHLQKKSRKNNSKLIPNCNLIWKCTNCKHVLDTEKRDPKQHMCGEYKCKGCTEYVDSSHLCYIRALDPRKQRSKYIFFDFECSQSDDIITCKSGYTIRRDPDCKTCKHDTDPCKMCLRCSNCQQTWCNKRQHTPNLAIAQMTCELCIDTDLTQSSKCVGCGSRCHKCNKYNRKEKCFEVSPCEGCGLREVIFRGSSTNVDFCQWLFNERHKDFTVIEHNMKGYDGYFLLEYLIDNSLRPDNIIYAGSKIIIMSMTVGRGLNIRILDSLNFFPMKLSQLPDAFTLTELKKGYFPHFFNTGGNQTYVGTYPAAHYYGSDYMNTKDREDFIKWHHQKIDNKEIFEFGREIVEYCRSDVDILRHACLKFREILMSVTGGVTDTDCDLVSDGIDPFNDVTIAGVCSKVYRTKFLKEKWEVKLECDGVLTDWIPAVKQDGKLKVCLNGTWLNEKTAQDKGYIISKRRFINSPLAQVPSCGYTKRDNFSEVSIKWLEWCMHNSVEAGCPIHIRHALNGGEVRIPGSNYRVDGYQGQVNNCNMAQKGGTVYEFLGCFWHGCRT